MRRVLIAVGTLSAMAAPAAAGTLIDISSTSPCTLPYTGAVACEGYYNGNLDGPTVAAQTTAINDLLTTPTVGTGIGGSAPSVDYSTLQSNGDLLSAPSLVGNTLNFGTTLFGYQIIGLHFGNNSDPAQPPTNSSAFYLFNFGTAGATGITFTPNSMGFSDGVLFTAGPVPEPATWAMMLLGFAGIGFAMRRSRHRSGTLRQIA